MNEGGQFSAGTEKKEKPEEHERKRQKKEGLERTKRKW